MKSLFTATVLILFVSIEALTPDEITALKSYYDDCVKSTGVNNDLILKARKGEFSSDSNLQKYYFCMFTKIGIINENGDVQLEVVRNKAPSDLTKENVEKVISVCKDKTGKDKYDTARTLYECYYKETDKHIIF